MKSLKDFAYYYPERYWSDGTTNWIKSLILFFDGVGVTLNEIEREAVLRSQPEVTIPMLESGLLRIWEPAALPVAGDSEYARLDTTGILHWTLENGHSLGPLSPQFLEAYQEAGDGPNDDLARRVEEAHARHDAVRQELAQVTGDDDAEFCGFANEDVLSAMRAQALTVDSLENPSARMWPVTNRPKFVRECFSDGVFARTKRNIGPVSLVQLDLLEVSVNLTSVPIEEVLDFRSQHGAEYRAYRRNLHQVAAFLSLLSTEQQIATIDDRIEELHDLQADLRRLSRRSFRSVTASFFLGAVAAGVSAAGHDPFGAASAGLNALQEVSQDSVTQGPFTYLFRAQATWRNR